MKIIKESIVDISSDASVLSLLSKELRANYILSIVARTFTYEIDSNGECLFDIQNLQDVFYNVTIYPDSNYCPPLGDIELVSYEESCQEIFYAFSHDDSGVLGEDVDKNVALFWVEISRHFHLPPTHTYVHIPEPNSYFDEGIFWQFCYIYLNDKTKQGIVIAADACD